MKKTRSFQKKILFFILSVILMMFAPKIVLADAVENMVLEIPNRYLDENGKLQQCTIFTRRLRTCIPEAQPHSQDTRQY